MRTSHPPIIVTLFVGPSSADLVIVPHERREAGQEDVADDAKGPHVCNIKILSLSHQYKVHTISNILLHFSQFFKAHPILWI